MGEEKKPDEQKNPATDTKDEQKNPGPEEKPKPDEKKPENPENQSNKEINNNNDSQPEAPPPPAEIVLRVYMHCEGCARKVHRCLKGFEGVEDVITDCKSHKVVVKGEKADPLKVVERVQKKTRRQVELLSPIPKPAVTQEENKVVEKEEAKTEGIKTEPKVITVVLKVHMHCEACSLDIKKQIERMKEVEEAIPDLKSSQVSVKGTFDPPKLVDYVNKRTGKHAIIVKQEPPQETKKDDKGKDGKDEKRGEEEGKKTEEKGEEGKGEKKEEGDGAGGATGDGGPTVEGEETKMELRRNEYNYNYYAPRYAMEMNTYPPQMFSDENPNACSVM